MVNSSIDDTIKLQKLIDTTGDVQAEYIFPSEGDILINNPVRVFKNTKWTGNGVKFHLMSNAPIKPFGEQIPLIGSKYANTISGLEFTGLNIDGNGLDQKYSTAAPTSGHAKGNVGKGYHNFFGFKYVTNLVIHDVDMFNSQGDGVRIDNFSTTGTSGTNLHFYDITSEAQGHDVFHLNHVKNAKIHNCNVKMRCNNVIRIRNSSNIEFNDNVCYNEDDCWGPAIQLENIDQNAITSKVYIHNNYIYDTYSPAIWALGGNKSTSTSDVVISNNLIVGCGKMPGNNNIPGVGGLVADGYNLKIIHNTFDKCLGYGILTGKYVGSSVSNGQLDVIENIITNTGKCYCPSNNLGTAIANLTGSRNIIYSKDNCLFGNGTNYYDVSLTSDFYSDPLFVDKNNYHLQSKGGHWTDKGFVLDLNSSPCIFPDHEIGYYSGSIEASKYLPPLLPTLIIPRSNKEDLRNLVLALWNSNIIDKTDKISFENVSDGFKVE